MNNDTIRETIAAYIHTYPNEDIASLEEFVAHNTELISRKNPAGHITGSVVLLNAAGEALLIENPKFPSKLIFPGGHLDIADSSVEEGALRELREEMGIDTSSLHSLTKPGMPLDVDIHWIAANERKGEGTHRHYDFRFAFVCDEFPKFAVDEAEVRNIIFMNVEELRQIPIHARIAGKIWDGGQLVSIFCPVGC